MLLQVEKLEIGDQAPTFTYVRVEPVSLDHAQCHPYAFAAYLKLYQGSAVVHQSPYQYLVYVTALVIAAVPSIPSAAHTSEPGCPPHGGRVQVAVPDRHAVPHLLPGD
jgi:hypothetical protein